MPSSSHADTSPRFTRQHPRSVHPSIACSTQSDCASSTSTSPMASTSASMRHSGGPDRRPSGPEIWQTYMREEIPPLFGLEFSKGLWQQVFIRKDGHIFLLVTLEKGGQQKQFQYDDRFLSPTEFQWQSQNQTARDSNAGRAIQQHEAEGTLVHLFVRQTKLHKLQGGAVPLLWGVAVCQLGGGQTDYRSVAFTVFHPARSQSDISVTGLAVLEPTPTPWFHGAPSPR
jgi:hypothetical protein